MEGLAQVSGWIDLSAMGPTLPRVARTDSRQEATAPGISIDFREQDSDWQAGADCFILALGQPTVEGKRAHAIDLLRCHVERGGDLLPVGGRYSLLIVDLREASVRLQTDRFAVWPMCWALEGSRLAFSDRADCVPLAGPRTLDRQALFNYVYSHVTPAPRTVFHGISRLEPATELRCSRDRAVEMRTTWKPSFNAKRLESREHLSEAFRTVVRQSVAEQADGSRAGAFLSGGTDSSTVAGVLKEATGAAKTFSIGFDEAGYDEMAYARIAAKHFGTDHHEHYVTPAELVDAIPLVAAHYDQPFGNSSAVPAFICARLARESGVDKLLAGDGGDELFGGNSRYAKQKIFEAWRSVPRPLRPVLDAAFNNSVTRGLPLLRKGASYIEQASVPMPARLETYNLLTRFGPSRVFRRDFVELVDGAEPPRLQAEVYSRERDAPFVDRMLAYDWRFTLADNDLPKVRGTTRLAGLDVGFPLLADALVDLSTQLGPTDKVRGLKLRYFFKESLRGFLPKAIIAKKKHGFGLPVGRWLVSDPRFRALAQDSITQLSHRGLVKPELVDELFSRRLEEHAGYHGEMAWVLMMLEQWLNSRAPNLSF